ncbi:MAG: DUF3299 domain-containing protein [Xanthomonadales bacterium]|nr:DUF3299 domain-containing protein [Xanthomonadales bacterium]
MYLRPIPIAFISLFASLTMTGCGSEVDSDHAPANGNPTQASASASSSDASKPAMDAYPEVEWVALMPQDDLDALLNPPAYLDEIIDGSLDDEIDSNIQNESSNERGVNESSTSEDRYQQALVSTRVVESMSGTPIRIPGFVVPISFNDEQAITEFFLVPFFGACIHLPPPPPNQIILVKANDGVALDDIYEPIWIAGTISTQLTEHELATSTYSMNLDHWEIYID